MRFIVAACGWMLHLSIFVPLAIIGLFAVPVAIVCRHSEWSLITGQWITNAPRWLWLWGNDEDGFCSVEARRHYRPNWPLALNMWWWAAIRNPVGNLRFIQSLYPPPEADRIRFLIAGSWVLTWQGWRHHLEWHVGGHIYTIGWKYYPTDANPFAELGWRAHGCGFALRRKSG